MTRPAAGAHPAAALSAKRIRLLDVAIAAGVARSTAGLALRGAPRVSEATRLKVREAADTLGYVPDRLAARLRGGRSGSVGLLVADLTHPFQAQLIAALQMALDEAGMASFLAHAGEAPERQLHMLTRLREQGVDGVVVLPAAGSRPELLDALDLWGLPWVTLLRGFRRGPHVGVDDRAGLALATRHLIAAGHRRIAFLGGAAAHSVTLRRRAGYLQAMREAGLPPQILPCGPEIGAAAEIAAGLFRARPTALACCDDVIAFGAMLGLSRAGRRPGVEVAVTGFGDLPGAAHWVPPLTSLRVAPEALAAATAGLLLDRIAAPEAAPRRVVLAPELVVRASCGSEKGPPAAGATGPRPL